MKMSVLFGAYRRGPLVMLLFYTREYVLTRFNWSQCGGLLATLQTQIQSMALSGHDDSIGVSTLETYSLASIPFSKLLASSP